MSDFRKKLEQSKTKKTEVKEVEFDLEEYLDAMIVEDYQYMDAEGSIVDEDESAVDIVVPLRYHSMKYKRTFVVDSYLIGVSGRIYKVRKTGKSAGQWKSMKSYKSLKCGFITKITLNQEGIKDREPVYMTGALVVSFIDEDYENALGYDGRKTRQRSTPPCLLDIAKGEEDFEPRDEYVDFLLE